MKNFPSSLNVDKYQEVIRLLVLPSEQGGLNNENLGRVKLMKLLYYVDFNHFYKYGRSITGDKYYKRDYGPVPFYGSRVIRHMQDAELLMERVTERGPHRMFQYSLPPRSVAPLTHLSQDEVDTIREVIRLWTNASTQDIILASHGDPPWQLVDYNEEISFHLVHYRDDFDPKTDEEPEVPSQPRPVRRTS